VKVEFGLKFLNDIFNPTFGFVHIWPKFWLKQQTWTYLRWTMTQICIIFLLSHVKLLWNSLHC